MVERLNRLRGLEGMTLADLISLADGELGLGGTERSDFLRDVSLVLDQDPTGVAGVIDPGEETLALADRFLSFYPDLHVRSITAADVSDYVTELPSRGAKLLERRVRQMLELIRNNPHRDCVTFLGRPYRLGADDLNAVVNDALEAAGSSQRVSVGFYVSGDSMAMMGVASHEQKRSIGDYSLRMFEFERPEFFGAKPQDGVLLGSADQRSTIITLRDGFRSLLAIRRSDWDLYLNVRWRAVHWRLFEEFFHGRTTPERADTLWRQVTRIHEVAHFETLARLGEEYGSLIKEGQDDLFFLDEIYASLATIEEICRISETDPAEALEMYRLYNILAAGSTSENPRFQAEMCVSHLLLSAARAEGPKIDVDWGSLRSRTASLRAIIFRTLEDTAKMSRAAVLDLPFNSDPDAVKRLFEEKKRQAFEGLTKAKPDLTEPARRLEASRRVIEEAQTRRTGRILFLPQVVSAHSRWARDQLNGWLADTLGIPPAQLPF